jgi:hypothetical protein
VATAALAILRDHLRMRILSIDCEIGIDEEECTDFMSSTSLFDFDVVFWGPGNLFSNFEEQNSLYRGRPSRYLQLSVDLRDGPRFQTCSRFKAQPRFRLAGSGPPGRSLTYDHGFPLPVALDCAVGNRSPLQSVVDGDGGRSGQTDRLASTCFDEHHFASVLACRDHDAAIFARG